MGYKVVKAFYDLKDDNYHYEVGDPYPRKGKKVSDDRLAFLAGNKNLLRTPVIVLEKVTKTKK